MLFALASCSKNKEEEAKNDEPNVEEVVFSRESGTYSKSPCLIEKPPLLRSKT